MTREQKIETAAKNFFIELRTGEQWDFTAHKAKRLVLGAFALYCDAWDGADVRRWEWPIATLRKGKPFDGDEPWTVLLRRAVEIANGQHKEEAA